MRTFFLILVLLVGLGFSLRAGNQGLKAVPGDQRPADRDAIRAHIDKIFQAYMKKDRPTVLATHGRDWRGFLNGSRSIVRGLDQYMQAADAALQAPGFIASYRFAEFDMIFYGNIALVNYIADVELDSGTTPSLRATTKWRSIDIYAKLNNEWIQVGSHLNTHPDAQAARQQQPQALTPAQRELLLNEREAVWRAWFANRQTDLDVVIPPDTVAINAGEEAWADRDAVLSGARKFAQAGGKLLRLEYPKTEIRVYGDVAVLYTTYVLETETNGQRQTQSGRGTEIFVRRNGRWVNPGWHLDSGK